MLVKPSRREHESKKSISHQNIRDIVPFDKNCTKKNPKTLISLIATELPVNAKRDLKAYYWEALSVIDVNFSMTVSRSCRHLEYAEVVDGRIQHTSLDPSALTRRGCPFQRLSHLR